MKAKFILLSLGIFILLACDPDIKEGKVTKKDKPYVVMLSMDAFRWDYPDIYKTPNLDSIAQIGVKAKSLQPCFPSKTFPNHYSMATGLHPDHHGIVQNNFYDPELGEFRLTNRDAVSNPGYYGGEPIWVTAEKQNVNSACYFWPGSEASINGYHPDIWKEYDEEVSFMDRMDSVISWLQMPYSTRPHLILWYMHEPDEVGHDFGPYANETSNMVEHLDSLVGVFCQKINSLPNADSINIIFTADHGMSEITVEKTIILSENINPDWIIDIKGSNPVFFIQPKEGFEEQVHTALDKIQNMKCYTKDDFPERYVFGNNNRIYELTCVADSSWSIEWDNASYSRGGAHGYDPFIKDMQAIFYADGPAFKDNYDHPTFTNIHLYSLIAEILGLNPVKTDGDLSKVKSMLK